MAGSVHTPSHSESPTPHDPVHVELEQTCAGPHAAPHDPQCCAELRVSTQVPSQRVMPSAHEPPETTVPSEHPTTLAAIATKTPNTAIVLCIRGH